MKKKNIKKTNNNNKLSKLSKKELINIVSSFLYKDFSKDKLLKSPKNMEAIDPNKSEIDDQFIREVENFQEQMVFNGILNHEFVRELEYYQEKIFKDMDIDKQFVIEVEDSQEKLVKTHAFSKEFVREIEKSQEKLAWTWGLTKEFIKEVEVNQEKLSVARNELTYQLNITNKLQKLQLELIQSESLPEVDSLKKKIERVLKKSINELEKTLYKVS